MRFSTENIALTSAKHPWLVVVTWITVLAVSVVLIQNLLQDALDGTGGPTKTLEHMRAQQLIEDRLEVGIESSSDSEPSELSSEGSESSTSEFILMTSHYGNINEESFQSYVDEVWNKLEELEGVVLVGTRESYVPIPSQDGSTIMFRVNIIEGDGHNHSVDQFTSILESLEKDEFGVYAFGDATINAAFQELAEHDLLVGESIGIGVAIIILLLVYGSVVSGLIPIVLAIIAVVTTVGMTAVVGQFIELNEFVPNIVTMMGLAVGIDYSLFVLSRYREERARGLSNIDAIGMTGSTASRAVFVSGCTVVLALTGLLLLPEKFFQAFGTGAIMVVFIAVLICLTLLPAIIGLLGDRINNVSVPSIPVLVMFIIGVILLPGRTEPGRVLLLSSAVVAILVIFAIVKRLTGIKIPIFTGNAAEGELDRGGFWDAITRIVMAKPVLGLLTSVALLVALIFPFFDLQKGTSGISMLPDEEPVKQAFVLLSDKYGFGSDSPARVVVAWEPSVVGTIHEESLQNSIKHLESLLIQDRGTLDPTLLTRPGANIVVLDAPVLGDPFSQPALNTIRRIRTDIIPEAFSGLEIKDYEVLVGGASAEIVDSVEITDQYTPLVFAVVLGLSFILLLVAFRSLVIPIASIFMNLLSVGAAYGLVVLVFQKGFLIDIFGFQMIDQVEYWLPLFMFSILFGLSMDYHVFMLSRIKEHYDETKDHGESVAFGLRNTARIITGAALIMVAVFGGFALGDIAFFQSMGFGLGSAILLDATVVRSILVPSVLRLLGKHSWYFPRVLEWIPDISIEGSRDRSR